MIVLCVYVHAGNNGFRKDIRVSEAERIDVFLRRFSEWISGQEGFSNVGDSSMAWFENPLYRVIVSDVYTFGDIGVHNGSVLHIKY